MLREIHDSGMCVCITDFSHARVSHEMPLHVRRRFSHMLWNIKGHRVDATGIDAFDVVKLCSSLRPLLPLALAQGAMGYRRRQNSTAVPNVEAPC